MGDSKKFLQVRSSRQVPVRVKLLDDEVLDQSVDKRAVGWVLFDKVCEHLNILEKDYFGLNYIDATGMKYWLNNDKKISKQLKGLKNWDFQFEVKFYHSDPAQLAEDLTRYQLCLQIRRDIVNERLPCSFVTYTLLGSYTAQSELGDYDTEEFGSGYRYLKDIQFAPHQDKELLVKIAELHRQHKGQSPEEAEVHFLENAKKLAMYGVELHPAKDAEGKDISLGVGASGLIVYKDKAQINRFVWPKVLKISYRRNKYYIKIRPGEFETFASLIGFKLLNVKYAKRLWKISVEHHSFFRFREPEEIRSTSLLPRFGSRFRYSGRTQYQTRLIVAEENRESPFFDRVMSKRGTFGGRTQNMRKRDEDRQHKRTDMRRQPPTTITKLPEPKYSPPEPKHAPPVAPKPKARGPNSVDNVSLDREPPESLNDSFEDVPDRKSRIEKIHGVATPLAAVFNQQLSAEKLKHPEKYSHPESDGSSHGPPGYATDDPGSRHSHEVGNLKHRLAGTNDKFNTKQDRSYRGDSTDSDKAVGRYLFSYPSSSIDSILSNDYDDYEAGGKPTDGRSSNPKTGSIQNLSHGMFHEQHSPNDSSLSYRHSVENIFSEFAENQYEGVGKHVDGIYADIDEVKAQVRHLRKAEKQNIAPKIHGRKSKLYTSNQNNQINSIQETCPLGDDMLTPQNKGNNKTDLMKSPFALYAKINKKPMIEKPHINTQGSNISRDVYNSRKLNDEDQDIEIKSISNSSDGSSRKQLREELKMYLLTPEKMTKSQYISNNSAVDSNSVKSMQQLVNETQPRTVVQVDIHSQDWTPSIREGSFSSTNTARTPVNGAGPRSTASTFQSHSNREGSRSSTLVERIPSNKSGSFSTSNTDQTPVNGAGSHSTTSTEQKPANREGSSSSTITDQTPSNREGSHSSTNTDQTPSNREGSQSSTNTKWQPLNRESLFSSTNTDQTPVNGAGSHGATSTERKPSNREGSFYSSKHTEQTPSNKSASFSSIGTERTPVNAAGSFNSSGTAIIGPSRTFSSSESGPTDLMVQLVANSSLKRKPMFEKKNTLTKVSGQTSEECNKIDPDTYKERTVEGDVATRKIGYPKIEAVVTPKQLEGRPSESSGIFKDSSFIAEEKQTCEFDHESEMLFDDCETQRQSRNQSISAWCEKSFEENEHSSGQHGHFDNSETVSYGPVKSLFDEMMNDLPASTLEKKEYSGSYETVPVKNESSDEFSHHIYENLPCQPRHSNGESDRLFSDLDVTETSKLGASHGAISKYVQPSNDKMKTVERVPEIMESNLLDRNDQKNSSFPSLTSLNNSQRSNSPGVVISDFESDSSHTDVRANLGCSSLSSLYQITFDAGSLGSPESIDMSDRNIFEGSFEIARDERARDEDNFENPILYMETLTSEPGDASGKSITYNEILQGDQLCIPDHALERFSNLSSGSSDLDLRYRDFFPDSMDVLEANLEKFSTLSTDSSDLEQNDRFSISQQSAMYGDSLKIQKGVQRKRKDIHVIKDHESISIAKNPQTVNTHRNENHKKNKDSTTLRIVSQKPEIKENEKDRFTSEKARSVDSSINKKELERCKTSEKTSNRTIRTSSYDKENAVADGNTKQNPKSVYKKVASLVKPSSKSQQKPAKENLAAEKSFVCEMYEEEPYSRFKSEQSHIQSRKHGDENMPEHVTLGTKSYEGDEHVETRGNDTEEETMDFFTKPNILKELQGNYIDPVDDNLPPKVVLQSENVKTSLEDKVNETLGRLSRSKKGGKQVRFENTEVKESTSAKELYHKSSQKTLNENEDTAFDESKLKRKVGSSELSENVLVPGIVGPVAEENAENKNTPKSSSEPFWYKSHLLPKQFVEIKGDVTAEANQQSEQINQDETKKDKEDMHENILEVTQKKQKADIVPDYTPTFKRNGQTKHERQPESVKRKLDFSGKEKIETKDVLNSEGVHGSLVSKSDQHNANIESITPKRNGDHQQNVYGSDLEEEQEEVPIIKGSKVFEPNKDQTVRNGSVESLKTSMTDVNPVKEDIVKPNDREYSNTFTTDTSESRIIAGNLTPMMTTLGESLHALDTSWRSSKTSLNHSFGLETVDLKDENISNDNHTSKNITKSKVSPGVVLRKPVNEDLKYPVSILEDDSISARKEENNTGILLSALDFDYASVTYNYSERKLNSKSGGPEISLKTQAVCKQSENKPDLLRTEMKTEKEPEKLNSTAKADLLCKRVWTYSRNCAKDADEAPTNERDKADDGGDSDFDTIISKGPNSDNGTNKTLNIESKDKKNMNVDKNNTNIGSEKDETETRMSCTASENTLKDKKLKDESIPTKENCLDEIEMFCDRTENKILVDNSMFFKVKPQQVDHISDISRTRYSELPLNKAPSTLFFPPFVSTHRKPICDDLDNSYTQFSESEPSESESSDSGPSESDSDSGQSIELAAFEMPKANILEQHFDFIDPTDTDEMQFTDGEYRLIPRNDFTDSLKDDNFAIDCSFEDVKSYKVSGSIKNNDAESSILCECVFSEDTSDIPDTNKAITNENTFEENYWDDDDDVFNDYNDEIFGYGNQLSKVPEIIDETPHVPVRSNLKFKPKEETSLFDRRVHFQEVLPVYKSTNNVQAANVIDDGLTNDPEHEKMQYLENFITCLFDKEPRNLSIERSNIEDRISDEQTIKSEKQQPYNDTGLVDGNLYKLIRKPAEKRNIWSLHSNFTSEHVHFGDIENNHEHIGTVDRLNTGNSSGADWNILSEVTESHNAPINVVRSDKKPRIVKPVTGRRPKRSSLSEDSTLPDTDDSRDVVLFSGNRSPEVIQTEVKEIIDSGNVKSKIHSKGENMFQMETDVDQVSDDMSSELTQGRVSQCSAELKPQDFDTLLMFNISSQGKGSGNVRKPDAMNISRYKWMKEVEAETKTLSIGATPSKYGDVSEAMSVNKGATPSNYGNVSEGLYENKGPTPSDYGDVEALPVNKEATPSNYADVSETLYAKKGPTQLKYGDVSLLNKPEVHPTHFSKKLDSHEKQERRDVLASKNSKADSNVTKYTYTVTDDSDADSPIIKSVTYEYITEYKLNNVKIHYQQNQKVQTDANTFTEIGETKSAKHSAPNIGNISKKGVKDVDCQTESIKTPQVHGYDRDIYRNIGRKTKDTDDQLRLENSDTKIEVEEVMERSIYFPLGPISGFPSILGNRKDTECEIEEVIERSICHKLGPAKSNCVNIENNISIGNKNTLVVKENDSQVPSAGTSCKGESKRDFRVENKLHEDRYLESRQNDGTKMEVVEDLIEKSVFYELGAECPKTKTELIHQKAISNGFNGKPVTVNNSDTFMLLSIKSNASTSNRREKLTKDFDVDFDDSLGKLKKNWTLCDEVDADCLLDEYKTSETVKENNSSTRVDSANSFEKVTNLNEAATNADVAADSRFNRNVYSALMQERLPKLNIDESTNETMFVVQTMAVLALGTVLVFLLPYMG